MSEWTFTHSDRVRYADIDTMRHLNNVAFLEFFESARIAFMGHLFPEYSATDPAGFPLILAEVHVAYRAPAYFDEEIHTHTRAGDLQRSSFRVEFEMRAGEDGRLAAEGWGTYVGYDYAAEEARPLPDELAERLRAVAR